MSMANEFLQEATKMLTSQSRKKEWYEEVEEEICAVCPKMTYQQRIGGCVTFMLLGFMLSLGSLTRLFQLLLGNPVPFATMYSLGNIISLCSTCFLYGPWTQAKKMFAPTRLLATGVYLFFLVLTMFLAFYPHKILARGLLLVISIAIQFLALCWYSISFIPFARDIVKKCCMSTCCGGSEETSMPEYAENDARNCVIFFNTIKFIKTFKKSAGASKNWKTSGGETKTETETKKIL